MKTHLALPLRIPALALALAAGAHGMVTVKVSTTRPGVLDPEKPQAFFARVEGADGRNRCKWEVWENGVQVGPAQGVFLEEGAKDGSVLFSATSGAGQRSFTLRAYSKADPSASGELAVQVGHGLPPPRTALPAGVIGLIAEYADSAEGDSAMSLMADPVPSWYVEMTRQAWFPALPAHPEWASLVPVRAYGDRPYRELKINGDGRGPHIVGYGCPAFLTWEPPAGTERQILSVQPWVPGARPALQPLESKATGVEHRFTGRCTIGVETIVRSGKSWESEDIYCSPTVRGLL